MRRLLPPSLILLVSLLVSPAFAGTTIDLSAEASLPAANDRLRAMVYAEASGNDPASLARQVNESISEALRVIKGKPGVTVKTGLQNSYPVYGNNRRIEGWRMHSELLLESAEASTLSELLGRLQQMKLALGNLTQFPAEATRQAVEEAATRAAIQAFQRRAEIIAASLGKAYRIKQLNIQQANNLPPPMPLRATRSLMMADAAPAPIEAGDSTLSVTINGQIELLD